MLHRSEIKRIVESLQVGLDPPKVASTVRPDLKNIEAMDNYILALADILHDVWRFPAIADDLKQLVQRGNLTHNPRDLIYYDTVSDVDKTYTLPSQSILRELCFNAWGFKLSLRTAIRVIDHLGNPNKELTNETIDACSLLLAPPLESFDLRTNDARTSRTVYMFPTTQHRLEGKHVGDKRALYADAARAFYHYRHVDAKHRVVAEAAVNTALATFHIQETSKHHFAANQYRHFLAANRPNGQEDDEEEEEENDIDTHYAYNPNWRCIMSIFHVGGNHWVLVVFMRHGDALEKLAIIVFDSYRTYWKSDRTNQLVREKIYNLLWTLNDYGFAGLSPQGTIPYVINGFRDSTQTDGTSCGLHCLRNAELVVDYFKIKQHTEARFDLQHFLDTINRGAPSSQECKGPVLEHFRNGLKALVSSGYYLHYMSKKFHYKGMPKELASDYEIPVEFYILREDVPQALIEIENIPSFDITVYYFVANSLRLSPDEWDLWLFKHTTFTHLEMEKKLEDYIKPDIESVAFMWLTRRSKSKPATAQLDLGGYYDNLTFTTKSGHSYTITKADGLGPKSTLEALVALLKNKANYHDKVTLELTSLLDLPFIDGKMWSFDIIPMLFVLGPIHHVVNPIEIQWLRTEPYNILWFELIDDTEKPYKRIKSSLNALPPSAVLGECIRSMRDNQLLSEIMNRYVIVDSKGILELCDETMRHHLFTCHLTRIAYMELQNYVEARDIRLGADENDELIFVFIPRDRLQAPLPQLSVEVKYNRREGTVIKPITLDVPSFFAKQPED